MDVFPTPTQYCTSSNKMKHIISLIAPFLVASCVVTAEWIGEIKQEGNTTYHCKCYSDHSCYPTTAEWNVFNETVDGRLQRAFPPGAVCHNNLGNVSTFNAAACAEYKAHFNDEQYL